MEVEESCKQLLRKMEAIGLELDSQATKSISKLIQKLQNRFPGFIISDNLDMSERDAVVPKGTERKTRTSKRGSRSIAPRRKPKRRKLSDSQADSNSAGVQPLVATDVEMRAILEEVVTPNSPALNATYNKASNSASEDVPQENASQNNLLANTADPPRLTPQPTAGEATVSAAQSLVSKEIQSSPPTKNGCFESSSGHDSDTWQKSMEKEKGLKSAEKVLECQVLQNVKEPQSVENCVKQSEEAPNFQVVTSCIMTEESEEDAEEPPSTTEVANEVPLVPADTPGPPEVSPEVVPPQNATVSKPAFVKPILPVIASTPNIEQHSTPWSGWLSRLGWGAASKIPAATITASVSHQPRTVNAVGKMKNGGLTNTVSKAVSALPGSEATKPVPNVCRVGRSVPRPPTMSRLNNLAKSSRANCSTIAAKAFGGPGLIHSASAACHSTGRATGGVRLGTGMLALSKEQAEKERRERLRAEMAEREERQREALERKALAHKAKVKAANERRAAVRANAEALAKKQEAEKLKKLLALKDKPLPFKPPISGVHRASDTVKKHQPLGTISSNVVTVTSHMPSVAANYVENFDFIKVPPPPPPPQPKIQVHPAPESPISYDLTGILDEYNSDSDADDRARKRHVPSWARPGSQFLVERVSKAYQGELRWQNIFRPAETIQFDDADLFYGYKFRTRPRGSSAVWTSPSKPHSFSESHNSSRP